MEKQKSHLIQASNQEQTIEEILILGMGTTSKVSKEEHKQSQS